MLPAPEIPNYGKDMKDRFKESMKMCMGVIPKDCPVTLYDIVIIYFNGYVNLLLKHGPREEYERAEGFFCEIAGKSDLIDDSWKWWEPELEK